MAVFFPQLLRRNHSSSYSATGQLPAGCVWRGHGRGGVGQRGYRDRLLSRESSTPLAGGRCGLRRRLPHRMRVSGAGVIRWSRFWNIAAVGAGSVWASLCRRRRVVIVDGRDGLGGASRPPLERSGRCAHPLAAVAVPRLGAFQDFSHRVRDRLSASSFSTHSATLCGVLTGLSSPDIVSTRRLEPWSGRGARGGAIGGFPAGLRARAPW